MTVEAFPLCSPAGRARTRRPERSRFDTSMAIARDTLLKEILRLGGRQPIISTNIKLRLDGLPYASAREPDDSGVAVYFLYGDGQQCFACDRWDLVRDNIQAICKTIKALRGIARLGTGDMMERAFTGFAALPAPRGDTAEHWSDVLGTHAMSTDDEILAAYRQARRDARPDAGGSSDAFHAVQEAWAQARQERGL